VNVASTAGDTEFLTKSLMTVTFPQENTNIIIGHATFIHNYSTLVIIMSLKMKAIILLKILESLESAINL
jgi:hypothetical protein